METRRSFRNITSNYHYGAKLIAPVTEYTLVMSTKTVAGNAHVIRLQDLYDLQWALGGESIPDWNYWRQTWINYRVNAVKFDIMCQTAARESLSQFVGCYVCPTTEVSTEAGVGGELVWRPATQAGWIGLKSDPRMVVQEKPISGHGRNGASTVHLSAYINTDKFNHVKTRNTGFTGGTGTRAANSTDPFCAGFSGTAVHPARSNYLVIYTRLGENVTEGAAVTASEIHFQIRMKFYIRVWDRISTFIGVDSVDDTEDMLEDDIVSAVRAADDYADGDTPP